MRAYGTLILAFATGISPRAQAQNLDSLYSVWQDQARPDSTRALAYHDYVQNGYLFTDPDSAFVLTDALFAFAEEHHLADFKAKAFNLKGISHAVRGQYPEALDQFRKCLQVYEETGSKEGSANAHRNLGNIYYNQGDYPGALRSYQMALSLFESIRDTSGIGTVLHSTGNVYGSLEDFAKALDYFRRALAIHEANGDKLSAAGTLANMAGYGLQLGNFTEALDHARRAVALSEEIGHKLGIAAGLVAIGEVYYEQGAYSESIDHYLRAKVIWEEMDSPREYSHLLGQLGRAYLAQGNQEQALDLCTRGEQIATEIGELLFQQDNCQCLYETYKTMGIEGKALEYHERYVTVRDSMFNEENTKKLTRLEMQYEFDKKEAAARAEQEKEDQRQRLVRNGITGGLASALLFLGVVWRQRNRIRSEKLLSDRLRQRAEASERFKQQFLANMSHEIRAPMNAIMGMTGILKRNERLPEQEKYLSAISQSSENLLVILNDILDLSKLEAGKIDLEQVLFDPRQVIGNVHDILRFKAEEKGIALEVDIDEGVPGLLQGDPTRLNQIVLNLAGNAVKFTESGSVTMRADWTNGAELRIDVIDTGIGMPEDRLEKIFEEFTQAYSDTTRKYGGTGLGLTISKRLAELQGGTITVKSERDKGSTFTLTIPYAIPQQDETTGHPSTSLSAGTRSDSAGMELRDLRILLAEDNEFNVMVAQDELADAIPGVQVDVAANGRLAVEMVNAKDYDVILMDVQMPEMNGYDATKAIRAFDGDKSKIPIIAMTANVLKEEVERCKEAGMDGFVPKPFKREELISALVGALA